MRSDRLLQTGETPFTKVIMAILCSIVVTIMIPTVIAFEFDNVASYDYETDTYTIINAFGLGDKIAEIELITPQIFEVGLGYQYVAEFELRDYDVLYGNAFQDMNFYQINSGMKEFTRDFDYRYLDYETDIRETYGEVCEDGNCTIQETGVEEYQKETWTKFSDVNELPQQDNIRVRIYTDVKNKDYVEWIPTMYGEYLEEWAIWSGNLSSGLVTYYDFSNTTGNLLDNIGSTDLTEQGTVGSSSGKFDNSRGPFSGTNYFEGGINGTMIDNDQEYTISWWFNGSASGDSNRNMWQFDDPSGSPPEYFIYADMDNNRLSVTHTERGAVAESWTDDADFSADTWNHVVIIHNSSGGGLYVYLNGTYEGYVTDVGSGGSAATDFYVGRSYDENTKYWDGYLDEIGIWERGLSEQEVLLLWNEGDGCNYENEDCLGASPIVTHISPANTTNSTTPSITLSANVTDDGGVTNAYLYIDGSLNNTNSSGVNGTYEWTYDFADGSYTWYVIGEDDEGTNTTMATYNFSVDTTVPTVNLYAPTTTTTTTLYATANSTDYTINWSSSDTNLDSCWYSTNETVNVSVTCNTNSSVTTPFGTYTVTVYANDSFGWETEASATPTYDYAFLKNAETFDASIVEGALTTFETNILTNGSIITVATLIHNGTSYAGTISGSSSDYNISRTISAPQVTADANMSWYWNITTNEDLNQLTTAQNQTVVNFGLDNCTDNSVVLYNFTIVAEQTQAKLVANESNTTAELDLQLYTFGRGSELLNYSLEYNQTNSFAVCINNSLSAGEQYNLDAQLQYDADGYAPEFYHIQNTTIDSTDIPTNITLYDLNDDDAQEFKLTYKDDSFLPVEDALVVVTRKYIADGLFKTVEIAKTDANGETIVHLELSDVIYTFQIIKNGVTLATYNNVLAKCNNVATGDCELNFNSFSSTINPKDYTVLDDFSYTLTYDSDTRLISTTYSIPSGAVSTVILNSTLFDQLGNTTVCSDTLTSASGTLSCTVPISFGNSTIYAKIYKDGTEMASGMIKVTQQARDLYGNSVVFLGLFLMLTVVGIGISGSPMITGLFLGLGAIISLALNLVDGDGFIGATATILWLFIAIILILIKGSKRQ